MLSFGPPMPPARHSPCGLHGRQGGDLLSVGGMTISAPYLAFANTLLKQGEVGMPRYSLVRVEVRGSHSTPSTPSLGHMRQKEAPGTPPPTVSFPRCPGPRLVCRFYLSEASYFCLICKAREVRHIE